MLSTLYKAVCASLLQADFTERINFCCLCLETLEDSGVSIYDEVVLQVPKHPRPEATTVAHIINFIMGQNQSVCDIMFMLKSVCKKCMEAAINCFKFIQCCKDNTKIISAILDNLEESCDKIPQEIIHNYNSIYIAVETNENEKENCLVKRYYDKNRLLVPQDTAFMRFKQITENTIENHIEMTIKTLHTKVQFDALDDSLQELMCCKKYISTEELLYDPNKPFELICRVCQERFTYNTSLRIHFFKVHRNSKVKCKKCSPPKNKSVLLNSPLLKTQKFYEHNESVGDNWQDEEDRPLKENILVESDTDSSNKKTIVEILEEIPEPITTASDGTKLLHGIYTCKKCKLNFKSHTCYINHLTSKQYRCKRLPGGYGEFICDYCGYSAFHKFDLIKHIKLKHLGEKRHTCEFCGLNCYSRSDLTKHILVHTKEKHLTCEICGRQCVSKLTLNEHMTVHTGEKPYPCPKCSKCFSRRGGLRAHMQRIHIPFYRSKCKFCASIFRTKNDKERHEARHLKPDSQVNKRLTPDYDKRTCEICGRKCISRSSLDTHMKIHTGEKPYSCPECSKSFRRGNDLSVHMQRVHNPVYKYKCKFCDSVSKTKADRRIHEMRHSRPNSNVNKKLRPPTVEQRYPCPKCSKIFKRSNCLLTHFKRIHNPVYSFKCNFCDSVFKTKGDKRIHEVRHLLPNSKVNKKLMKELEKQNKVLQQ